MEDKLHELTALLLARMKSHPDEFVRKMVPVQDRSIIAPYYAPRWEPALHTILEHGSDTDKLTIRNKLGELQMNEAHRWAMDELLNGEERRADERRREEEERKQYMQRQAMNALSSTYTNTPNWPTSPDEGILGAIKKGLGR